MAGTGHRPWASGSVCLEAGAVSGASPWGSDNHSNKVSSWESLQTSQGLYSRILTISGQLGGDNWFSYFGDNQLKTSNLLRQGLS